MSTRSTVYRLLSRIQVLHQGPVWHGGIIRAASAPFSSRAGAADSSRRLESQNHAYENAPVRPVWHQARPWWTQLSLDSLCRQLLGRNNSHENMFSRDTPIQKGSGAGAPPSKMPQDRIEEALRRLGPPTSFPDFVEKWNRRKFLGLGAAGLAATAVSASSFGVLEPMTLGLGIPVAIYWLVGLKDLSQSQHTLLRNFPARRRPSRPLRPVLGNVRYFLESIRPEIRQYFVESDKEQTPFSRLERSTVYQRAKGVPDTLAFGTRADVNEIGYEWMTHSTLNPCHVDPLTARMLFGGAECAPQHRYGASLLNISGMSFGALSSTAVLALNGAARMGGFYHNTGEGGISRHHLAPGGDLVWNIGTGYFGCRDMKTGRFSKEKFIETSSIPAVKMIEIKLGQGAKPAHGGILPASKVTADIAESRGVRVGVDCLSPLRHSAFEGAHGLLEFVADLRRWSGGKPTGFKLCVGSPVEVLEMVAAMRDTGITPDFITVDGGEGGSGAAPMEFSAHVGSPLVEGLTVVHRALVGAGLRDRVRVVCAGKITTGFGIVRNLALGADTCNAARAMMFALGCIQALKCNTNKCPTGIATQDPELAAGLVPEDKAIRVYRYHHTTVNTALELVGAVGVPLPSDVKPEHIMRRVSPHKAVSYRELYPPVDPGSLLTGDAPADIQAFWDEALARRRVVDRYRARAAKWQKEVGGGSGRRAGGMAMPSAADEQELGAAEAIRAATG